MSTAATPPTPENVAEMLTSGDNDYHDGNDWKPGLSAHGSVVSIRVTPYAEAREDLDWVPERLPDVHFRAVVVEGEDAPIVLDRAAFERRVNERFDDAVRKLGAQPLRFWPATIGALHEQILNLVSDLPGATQAETVDDGDDGTCGDCMFGRCHGTEPAECECARHEASVEAAQAEQKGGPE